MYIGWQDFNGSTTTSYGANQGSQYYTKYNTTWDGTWGMIYAPYYYYGVGINGWCMSIENPRKFISINQTKSSRGNPYMAWGRTGFHGGWSDNTDSETWRTYLGLLIQQIQTTLLTHKYLTVQLITIVLLKMTILLKDQT